MMATLPTPEHVALARKRCRLWHPSNADAEQRRQLVESCWQLLSNELALIEIAIDHPNIRCMETRVVVRTRRLRDQFAYHLAVLIMMVPDFT